MQIRISWQLLGAVFIFVVALTLLGRFAVSRNASVPAPSAIAPESPTAFGAIGPSTAIVLASPQLLAVSSTPSLEPATVTPLVSTTAEPPTATDTAEPTPTPTLTSTATQTPTATTPPTPTATPLPEGIVVMNRGYGQSEAQLGYAFIARNPNLDLIARNVPFQLIVYDAAGIVLRTDTGTIGVVEPGAEVGVAKQITLSPGLQAARIDVLLGSGLFVNAAQLTIITFENISFVPGELNRITGLARNPLTTPLEALPVSAIAFSGDGRIVGGGGGSIPFITAGGQAAADITVIISEAPASVNLYANPGTLLAP